MTNAIRRGDLLCIAPEWRDPGDEDILWIALDDESGGRLCIQPLIDLPIRPNQIVETRMVQPANQPPNQKGTRHGNPE